MDDINVHLGFCLQCPKVEELPIKQVHGHRYRGIPILPSWKASISMAENIILNRVEAITQSCLTPLVTGNHCEGSPSSFTLVSMQSWDSMTKVKNLTGQPNLCMIFHSPSWLMLLKAVSINEIVCIQLSGTYPYTSVLGRIIIPEAITVLSTQSCCSGRSVG